MAAGQRANPFRYAGAWMAGAVMVTGAIGPAAAQSPGAPEVLFRSDVLERTTGEPNTYAATFSTCDVAGSYRLVLVNGPDGSGRVSSGSIWLNGTAVVTESDLNQEVADVARPVTLAATNALEVRLAGGPGGRLRVVVDGYSHCLGIRITAPLPGGVLHEPATLVEGELESAGPAGVTLLVAISPYGQEIEVPVPVHVNGRRFAAWAPLARGSVRLTARASDQTGRSAEDAVTVTFAPDPPDNDRALPPDVTPTVGFAPLVVTFGGEAATDPDVDRLDLDVDSDGQPDFTRTDFAAPPHSVTYTYHAEGLYVATLVLHETATGRSFTTRVPINVIPRPDLVAVWTAFRAALARTDVDGALQLIALESRDRYRRVFQDLGSDLSVMEAELRELTVQVVNPEYATGSTTRVHDGAPEAFLVSFVRDADGIWRIASL